MTTEQLDQLLSAIHPLTKEVDSDRQGARVEYLRIDPDPYGRVVA